MGTYLSKEQEFEDRISNLEYLIEELMSASKNSSTSDEALPMADVGGALPDPYEGDLNRERIAEYRKLKPLYALDGGSIRDLFCAGVDWYKTVVERQ